MLRWRPPPTHEVSLLPAEGAPGVWQITVRADLPAPPEQVFTELTEPDRIRAHPGVSELTLLQHGSPVPHGPGAVREVVLPSGRFRERVVSWSPPSRLDYQVEASTAPIVHEGGTLTLHAHDGGTRVCWRSAFRLQPGAGGPLVAWWAAQHMADDLAWHLDAVGERLRGVQLRRHGPRLGWVLVPIALWNAALSPWLPATIGADEGVPGLLLLTEHALRVATVAAVALSHAYPRPHPAAWPALAASLVIYAASWLPLLVDPAAADVPALALAPAITPILFLTALAWLARSRWLGALGAAFWLAHVAHQLWV